MTKTEIFLLKYGFWSLLSSLCLLIISFVGGWLSLGGVALLIALSGVCAIGFVKGTTDKAN